MASVLPKVQLPLPVQGIRPNVDDFSVPPDALRSTSFNWLMRNGKLRTRPGLTAYANNPAGTGIPQGMITFRDVNSIFHHVHATDDKWWRYNSSTSVWDDISDGALLWGANPDTPVIFRVFNVAGNSYLLGVNGIDTPRAWDSSPSTNVFTLFGGSAPVSQTIGIVADRVLLGGLPSPERATIDVSAFQDHTTGWGVTQTAVLIETPGVIVSIQELGFNQAAVYKEDSIYLVSGTTGIAPLRFDLHTDNVPGPSTHKSIIPLTSNTHAILTRQGELYLFDGVNYIEHQSSDKVRRLFEEGGTQEFFALQEIHGFYHKAHNELWWFYTRADVEGVGPRDAIVIKLATGSVWKLNYNASVRTLTTSYYGPFLSDTNDFREAPFVGDKGGQFYLVEGQTDAGSAIDTNLETGLSDLGDPTRLKTVEETELFFGTPDSTQTPSVSITTSNSGETPQASVAQTITVTPTSEGPYTNGVRDSSGDRVSSRYIGIKISDATITDSLEYVGASITLVPRGYR